MPTPARTPVTVVGLGAMGAALASAYLAAGHPTTVWNRSPEKAAPLVERGARHAPDIRAAVAASPLTLACLTTYDATLAALEPAAAELAGRALVTLNSGSPSGARAMASWATGHGARFLDGAVKNVPTAVGEPETLLYYGGDRTVFDEYGTTLRVLGGDTQFLGPEPDLAALYEQAVGGTLLPALLGFYQGAALVTARGLKAETLVPHTRKWLEMIISVLPLHAAEIDRGDYADPLSSIEIFHAGIPYDQELGTENGLDVRWHEPMHDLLRRAMAEGRGDQSIAALVELLRNPAGTAGGSGPSGG
ncbi:NAD(P)-dependent oxidoreductase [Streptomyces spectabilis]|uniref:3-hydroxyisobutyrate dehydrogenase-like beta-hydroxyacid dehydrogenase n=1 Tax=Streptomyces spectabilis TaxID=68270 RepID=A0A5P2X7A2_STRST|nr:NAD(P)-binding domain-containing protein [Streptomyces spectabilis]MBB5106481.1 3-hydroxyisobutyrate dehydrogenase-like beta-hydroxyacid dehydrogenase [Streptomyces spectabilis]MCI3903090.1 NAD(P)-binding domain-containing protein [Streptomyces spectabilis]QEV60338.1 NAD(P)-dependent oxidoreductase [Streptomyces spectabilis]GGV32402.1 3-hydroxyisobutyrate dehydrogenase [Streptomyces spectabilis]